MGWHIKYPPPSSPPPPPPQCIMHLHDRWICLGVYSSLALTKGSSNFIINLFFQSGRLICCHHYHHNAPTLPSAIFCPFYRILLWKLQMIMNLVNSRSPIHGNENEHPLCPSPPPPPQQILNSFVTMLWHYVEMRVCKATACCLFLFLQPHF